MNRSTRATLVAIALLLWAAQATAQETQADAAEQPTAVQELIVTAPVTFRNRTEETAPVLSYDLEYFQRFEPLTVGDALKRVPSVAFLSDVLESDGVRLRGLDPGYTQILINGERVPGAGVDRSFFVDRIPAELIERVEVVRSSSANRSGDAVAGAINIVLRDALTLDGGYIRAGAIRLDDNRIRETVGAVYGGAFGPGRILLGANVQGRRNPKEKLSRRFDEPAGTLENIEVQTDTRNGRDMSFNAAYEQELAGGELELSGYFVRTDRREDEDSIEYQAGRRRIEDLLTFNDNNVDIVTDNWSMKGEYEFDMAGGETEMTLAFSVLKDRQDEVEEEYEYLRDTRPFPDDDRFTGDLTTLDLKDEEILIRVDHERELGTGVELEFGLDYTDKERKTSILTDRNRVTIPNPPAVRPLIPGPYGPLLPVTGGLNTIEERRIDPFVMLSGETGALKWEAGVRYDHTEVTVEDRTAGPADRLRETDYGFALPSASLRYTLTGADRIHLSAARTVRRPNFNQLSPALLEGELGDNDFVGDPTLKPETAWGVDVGYERRIGARGVAGVNVFYRDITDLIETFNTGEEGSEGEGTFVYQSRNTGDGTVYGIEFDLSTPLDMVGLPDTGVFLNYSWLDSEVTDELGERRFNDQAEYVLSLGFIQDLPGYGAAFGATFRKQGDAFGRVVGEEITTEYRADLEAFIEKRFGERLVVRFTGSNLLNASKDEVFDKFNTIEEQRARDYDEYELETEEAGPVFQLVARYAF